MLPLHDPLMARAIFQNADDIVKVEVDGSLANLNTNGTQTFKYSFRPAEGYKPDAPNADVRVEG